MIHQSSIINQFKQPKEVPKKCNKIKIAEIWEISQKLIKMPQEFWTLLGERIVSNGDAKKINAERYIEIAQERYTGQEYYFIGKRYDMCQTNMSRIFGIVHRHVIEIINEMNDE